MRQLIHIEAKSKAVFVDRVNEAYAELSRFQIIREHFNGPTDMYLIYEEPEAEPEEVARHCAECSLYKWNIGCPYTKGKVIRPKHPACDRFTQKQNEEEVDSYEIKALFC